MYLTAAMWNWESSDWYWVKDLNRQSWLPNSLKGIPHIGESSPGTPVIISTDKYVPTTRSFPPLTKSLGDYYEYYDFSDSKAGTSHQYWGPSTVTKPSPTSTQPPKRQMADFCLYLLVGETTYFHVQPCQNRTTWYLCQFGDIVAIP